MKHPDWFNEPLFPFKSRFFEVNGARIHYVDEGPEPHAAYAPRAPHLVFLFRYLIERLRYVPILPKTF